MEIDFFYKETPEASPSSLDYSIKKGKNSQWETALRKISVCTVTAENSNNLKSWVIS